MGKTRRSKPRTVKDNPTGLPSVRDVSLEEELLGDDDDVGSRSLQAIIEQVQAPNVEDKLCGLQTLASLSQKPDIVEQVLESGVVRIVGPLLVDPSSDIRNAAAGALRNLSLSGVVACDILVEQDILTPLFALIDQYQNDWHVAAANKLPNTHNSKEDTFIQSVHLIWNLCENSPRALELFTKATLLPILAKGLNVEQYGFDIAISVAQCLQVVTEDNPGAVELMTPFVCLLNSILQLQGDQPQILLLRTLAVGILLNLSAPPIASVLMTLSETLSKDHRTFVSSLSSALPLQDNPGEEEESDEIQDDTSKPQNIELQIYQTQRILEAQKCAVEILTNICSVEDTDDMDFQMDASDNSDGEDFNSDAGSGEALSPDRLPVDLLELLSSLGLIDKVWICTQPLAENVYNIMQESQDGKSVLKSVWNLRSSALLCLHNLCAALPLEQLGGASALRTVWLQMGRQVFCNSSMWSNDESSGQCNLLEATTALMRAVLERLAENTSQNGDDPSSLFTEVSDSDIQLMLEGEKHCVDPETRANWLRMLGLLGRLLPTAPLTKTIASFLLDVCAKEVQPWPFAEALDSLVDMFSEDDTDNMAFELGLVEKLSALSGLFKNKIRQHKRSLGERLSAVQTINQNLARFIKYKRSRLASMGENKQH